MPVIQRTTAVPANGVVENVLTGSTYEFAQQNRLITIGAIGEATGIEMTILNGADIVLEESPPALGDRYPIIPDEMYYTDVGVVGDRLVIRARNTTGGALNLFTITQISNL